MPEQRRALDSTLCVIDLFLSIGDTQRKVIYVGKGFNIRGKTKIRD